MKRSPVSQPPLPCNTSLAVGEGDGRFVVAPSRASPGETIAIFSDLPNGGIGIWQVSTGREIARFAGPKAPDFILYPLPVDLPAGEYLVGFSGPGGTWGQPRIQVTDTTGGPWHLSMRSPALRKAVKEAQDQGGCDLVLCRISLTRGLENSAEAALHLD